MNFQEAKKLISTGENEYVEFKRKVRHPEKIVREIVAFANTKGGHLFVGVNDDRTCPGIKHVEDEDYILRKSVRELCRPALGITPDFIRLSDSRHILHYAIAESNKKPHYALDEKNQRYGKAYIRVKDQSLQASREMQRILKLERSQKEAGFTYGDHEKILLHYLGTHGHITLRVFKEISQLSYRSASDIIVSLASNHVIRVVPREKEDWFVFAE